MEQNTFDDLCRTLDEHGPDAAVDVLCDRLRAAKDYRGLLYALLIRARRTLGVGPFPSGPAADLPAETHAAYEEAIRTAARQVGGAALADGALAKAWYFYRMIGEPGPVVAALADYEPKEEDDLQSLVHLAFYEGLQPRRGFDWILDRYGLCNAVTTLSAQDLPHTPDVKAYCVGRLVRTLYDELRERLLADIERTEGRRPDGASVRELVAGRETLFADGFAHIDVSHLGAVVQMAAQHLEPGDDLDRARQLCDYGVGIPKQLVYHADPPFDDQYRDYGVYLAILAGDRVEEGLAHFRAKADNADPETIGTYPAEVFVNLLLRLGRSAEALAVAKRHLTGAVGRPLTCPTVIELCQRAGDYPALVEAARAQGDAVHYLAGLLASR